MKPLLLTPIACMVLVLGCKSEKSVSAFNSQNHLPSKDPQNETRKPLSEKVVAEIALAKAASMAEKGAKLEVIGKVLFHNDKWSVDVWSMPMTPGGFVTIDISPDGQILHVWPGM